MFVELCFKIDSFFFCLLIEEKRKKGFGRSLFVKALVNWLSKCWPSAA